MFPEGIEDQVHIKFQQIWTKTTKSDENCSLFSARKM